MKLLLSTVINVIDNVLFLLVSCYEKYVYQPAQLYLTPLVLRVPRQVSVGKQKVTVFTANGVTLTRTTLVIFIAICLKYGLYVTAGLLVILNDCLDHLDGIVAKAHRKKFGNIDDPLLGGFLDAFCDKVVNVLAIWTLLLVVDTTYMSTLQLMVWYGVCSGIIAFECILGVVRVQDYYRVKYGPTPAKGSTLSLAASMAGKTKEKLENVGLALICVAVSYGNVMDTWLGCFGVGCLGISLRFAYTSLQTKLKARRRSQIAQMKEVAMEGSIKPTQMKAVAMESNMKPTQMKAVAMEDTKPPETATVEDDVFVSSSNHNSLPQFGYIPKVQSTPQMNFRLGSSNSESDEFVAEEEEDKRVDKVYTVGCFDLFHRGHIVLLKKMRKMGKEVIVGVHSDESYVKLKKKHTIDNIERRMANVKKYADQVFVISSTDPSPYLRCCVHLEPGQKALYIRGDDMPHFPGRSVVEPLMPVRLLPYTQGISSTMLRAQLLKEKDAQPNGSFKKDD